jgi:hypothetical protein
VTSTLPGFAFVLTGNDRVVACSTGVARGGPGDAL